MKAELRILAWPAFSTSASNPYPSELYRAMPPQHTVRDIDMSFYALLRSLFTKADILHLHWLERAFGGRRKNAFRVISTIAIVWLFKLRGTRIVWTVHNLEPHGKAGNAWRKSWPFSVLWRAYVRIVTGSLDGLIVLSESHVPQIRRKFPHLAELPYAVTPHPHYRGIYEDSIPPEVARARLGFDSGMFVLLFIGNIAPYKGVEDLIPAFRTLAAPHARLLVVGKPDSRTLQDTLHDLAGDDSRITLNLSFIPDKDLQNYFNAADLVVFPFRAIANSGSVLMALSFNRPVAVTAAPVFEELSNVVGDDWIYAWNGAVSAQTIAGAMQWVQAHSRTAEAPLDALNWSTVAERTSDFYMSLLPKRRFK